MMSHKTWAFTIIKVIFGFGSDILVAGCYDRDGQANVAVYRRGTWFVWQSATDSLLAQQFGTAYDAPVPAAFYLFQ